MPRRGCRAARPGRRQAAAQGLGELEQAHAALVGVPLACSRRRLDARGLRALGTGAGCARAVAAAGDLAGREAAWRR